MKPLALTPLDVQVTESTVMPSGRRKKDYAAETSADTLIAQAATIDGQAGPEAAVA